MAKKKKKKGRPQYKSGPKKGQFMSKRAVSAKRASKKKRKSKPKRKSTALAKRGKSTTMAKKKKKRKSRRRGGRGGGGGSLMRDKDLMIGGAIYGFISKPDADAESLAATFQEQAGKLPEIGNADITNGLALYFIDKYIWRNKYIRETSRAALTVGAVRFGRRGFTLGAGDGTGYEDALDVTDEGGKLSGVMD